MRLARPSVRAVLPGLCILTVAQAEVRLHGLLSDGAVVQSDAPVVVSGSATAGARIAVRLGGHAAVADVAADGRWCATLPPIPPGEAGDLVVEGDGRTVARGIVAGDVWLCAGQSNMEAYLYREPDWETLRLRSQPNLRLFKVAKALADAPTNDVGGAWHDCSREPPGLFSALGYRFGSLLRERRGTPVGIVQATMGGTLAWGWTPRDQLSTGLAARIVQAEWYDRTNTFRTVAGFRARKQAFATGAGPEPAQDVWLPSGLYNGMIAPLTPFAVRGVLWYQGESDGWRGHAYRTLLPALLAGWRAAWRRDDLPVLLVQLPRYREPMPDPVPRSFWAELREAQALTAQADPHAHLLVTIDLAEGANIDIHPRIKQGVSERALQMALGRVYGMAGVVSGGPAFLRCAREGSRMRLWFAQADGGLVLRATVADGGASGFSVAGADGVLRWANAAVDGDTVVVWHPDVDAPNIARYAWEENPRVTLFNGEGLPASPFRTDDWKSASEQWK